MRSAPKHREISRQLLAEIASGKYGPGGRLPSEAQLVTRFGVSRPTIGRALRDLQAEGLIDRRGGSGTYVRSSAPSRPANAPSRQLGLLVPGRATTELFDLICGELGGLARAEDYALLFEPATRLRPAADLSLEEGMALCEQLIAQRVQGVFFTPFDEPADQPNVSRRIAETLRKAGIAVVLLDRDLAAYPHRSDFDLVSIDNLAAGYLLAEHLIKLGCRNISFLAKPHSPSTIEARIVGASLAITQNGLAPAADWVQRGDADDARFVQQLVVPRRQAIICANDLIAAQLIRRLATKDIHVPRDLRVVGFDDVTQPGPTDVPLTTMRQPWRELALTAFRALMDRIGAPALPTRSLLLTPQLVVRESCGAYLATNESA